MTEKGADSRTKRKRSIIIGLIVVAIIVIGSGATYFYMSERIPPEDDLPDKLIVDNQKEMPEVKAFLMKYPDASISVDRSGKLAVDYRVDKQISGDDVRTLRLRVFAGNDARPQEVYIDCADSKNSHLTYDDILNYIKTENCLAG
jgi:predicted RNase H-related nuclease YkuK (DUF458 family)